MFNKGQDGDKERGEEGKGERDEENQKWGSEEDTNERASQVSGERGGKEKVDNFDLLLLKDEAGITQHFSCQERMILHFISII